MDEHQGNIQQLNDVKENELKSQAIQNDSDPILYDEAINQASREISRVQSVLDQSLFI